MPDIYAGDQRPARSIAREGERLRFDLNHPLAAVPLEVEARVLAVETAPAEHGGRCDDALEALAHGPGMQAGHADPVYPVWAYRAG